MSANLIHVASAVFNRPWAITPETYSAVCEVVSRRMRGDRLSAEEIDAAIGAESDDSRPGPQILAVVDAARSKTAAINGSVTMIPVHGIIGHRANLLEKTSSKYGASTEMIGQWVDQAVASPDVGAIVFDIDSPGGMAEGLPELSEKIFKARATKKTFAIANGLAASAAFYIGTSAEKFWVTPSGMVGSVGVLSSHIDISKADEMKGIKETLIYAGRYKVEGNPFEPLSGEARIEIQRIVDEFYAQFVGDVARNRGTTSAVVKRDYGQGRMKLGDEARAAGMVDKVASMDDLLIHLGVKRSPDDKARAEHDPDILRRRAELKKKFC